jgi:23S rRNA A1618 N6-methylase RlmF
MSNQFKDKRFLRDLLYSELYKKHGIRIEIPMNQLIPTYNSRMYYIDYLFKCVGPKAKKGLDIGTGSSCIYPIIGFKKYNWEFVATEIDPDSIYYSTENIKRNKCTEKIQIVKGEKKLLFVSNLGPFDFTMCNPPFYSSQDQIDQSRQLKEQDPGGICTGNANEMITDGGEVQFILQMINESQTFPATIFSTLVGIKASVDPIKEYLASLNASYHIHVFRIGKTSRSIITWKWAGFII